jgi:hypothetical protein
LSREEIGLALENGVATAQELLARGLIDGAALFLGGELRVVGPDGMRCFNNHRPPSVLSDISPSRGEISQSPSLPLPIPPREGEMSDRTEGGRFRTKAIPASLAKRSFSRA